MTAPLTWTRTPPVEAGWYFIKPRGSQSTGIWTTEVVGVGPGEDGTLVIFRTAYAGPMSFPRPSIEWWAGPLAPPPLPPPAAGGTA